MSHEQSFPEGTSLYFDQQRNRVANSALQEHAIYTAFAKINDRTSDHTSVAFPVQIEHIQHVDEPQYKNSLGALAVHIILLDEDLTPMISKPFEAVVKEGMWHVNDPIPVSERNVEPVKVGYFLVAMPNDPQMSNFIDSDDKNDPRSISSE